MILSNIKIHEALDNRWLVIEPEPRPRQKQANGPDCPYQTTAIDLCLGNEIAHFKEEQAALNIDLRRGNFQSIFGAHSERHEITESRPFVLRPQMLVLGKTREKVTLPITTAGPCLAARIEGRSSYARCGLLVHFTAPTIHAGFSGTITLEIINLGPLSITLAPNMPICQLIIEMVEGIPFRNDSQFQGQSTAGVLKRDIASAASAKPRAITTPLVRQLLRRIKQSKLRWGGMPSGFFTH